MELFAIQNVNSIFGLDTFFKRMARTASLSEVEDEEEEDRRLRPAVAAVAAAEEEEHLTSTSLAGEVGFVAKRRRCLSGCQLVTFNASIV